LTLFAVFLLAYVISQFFRAFLAVIAPRLGVELGLSPADLANMSAAFFAVFALAQFPIGLALDRIGPRRSVPVVMLAGVAGALLLSRAQTAASCVLAMGLVGLGCSPIYMGALFYYGRTESPVRFGFLSAVLLGIGSAGNLLAATPLALATEWIGWRAALAGIAVAMALSAFLFGLLVRDPPRAERPRSSGSAWSELRQVVLLPGFWTLMPLLTLGYACVVVERGLWVGPYFAEVHRLGDVPLGNAVLVMAISMSVGAMVFGLLERRFGGPKRLVVSGSLGTTLGFALLWMLPLPPLSLAVSVIAAIGFLGLCQPLLFAHARRFFPDHLLGRGITFANFLTIGGAGMVHFVSGAYVSALKDMGMASEMVWASLHIAFAAATLAALAVYLLSPVPDTPIRAS
jgi:MFS family permease